MSYDYIAKEIASRGIKYGVPQEIAEQQAQSIITLVNLAHQDIMERMIHQPGFRVEAKE